MPVVQSSCLNGCRDIDDDNEDVGVTGVDWGVGHGG